ncbi:MAG: DUF3520 domain-containing protein [Gammaproteobacteria bacterium]|nr:DUF3520 domain-containing protein [Gammaproteobacteria bacterium]
MMFLIRGLLVTAVMSAVGCSSEVGKNQSQVISPMPDLQTIINTADQTSQPVMESKVVGRQKAPTLYAANALVMEPSTSFPLTNTEKYISYQDNPVRSVSKDPISTFSIDVDTAAYSNIRRMLDREGRIPPSDAVRIEELINYFSYDYAAPESPDIPFSITTEVAPTPWNAHSYLVKIGLKGYAPKVEERPNANLVFLIDVSGSMQSPDKLPLLTRSLGLLVKRMTDQDRIALVVYAGAAGLTLDSTSAKEKHKILRAINALEAGGSTNGGAGIQLAYDIASQNYIESGINRVIVASDGDMNVGLTDHDGLIEMIKRKRKSGIALTTLGFGAGNYNYALMEQLADSGNGNAAYIDSITEAQKVLVNEMNATLLTIAKDVKLQIEFNPQQVSEYRLIGYENRLLKQEDFKNDNVDAGDIGAGHTVTAFYEITPANSEHTLLAESRYGNETEVKSLHASELAFIRLRFKQPDGDVSQEITRPILRRDMKNTLSSATPDFRFGSAVAGVGQLLKGGKYTGTWSIKEALAIARGARGDDPHGYRSGFINLAELADTIGLP